MAPALRSRTIHKSRNRREPSRPGEPAEPALDRASASTAGEASSAEARTYRCAAQRDGRGVTGGAGSGVRRSTLVPRSTSPRRNGRTWLPSRLTCSAAHDCPGDSRVLSHHMAASPNARREPRPRQQAKRVVGQGTGQVAQGRTGIDHTGAGMPPPRRARSAPAAGGCQGPGGADRLSAPAGPHSVWAVVGARAGSPATSVPCPRRRHAASPAAAPQLRGPAAHDVARGVLGRSSSLRSTVASWPWNSDSSTAGTDQSVRLSRAARDAAGQADVPPDHHRRRPACAVSSPPSRAVAGAPGVPDTSRSRDPRAAVDPHGAPTSTMRPPEHATGRRRRGPPAGRGSRAPPWPGRPQLREDLP